MDDEKKTMRMNPKDDNTPGNGVQLHDCGYPIMPGMPICPKCRRPVGGGPAMAQNGSTEKKTVVMNTPDTQMPNAGYNPSDQSVSSAKKTERFVAPDQDMSSAKKTERFVAPDQDMSSAKKTERFVAPDQDMSSAKKTERFVAPAYHDGGVNKKTVDFRQMQAPVAKVTEPVVMPHCSLKPVARENENSAQLQKREFEASKVILNRQNTDPENYSITSQQQAVLTFENGKWYIEDRSAYKTTYIRVTKKTELQDGDIVAMGDREFEFSTK
jgi:hypothetical protein